MLFNNQTWFLDYTGINHKVNYLGKWEKKNYESYQYHMNRKLDEYLYDVGYEEHMIKDIHPIRLKYKNDSVNMIFEGSFFKGDDLHDNIYQVIDHHKNLFDHLFHNHAIHFSDKVQVYDPKIYRIDISSNLKGSRKLNNITMQGDSVKLRKYYEEKSDRDKVTGIQYGNRGRDYVHFRCYLKEYDKNKYHDYLRFNTADFTRLEYELGSRPIKCYGVRYLEDFPIKEYRQLMNGKEWYEERTWAEQQIVDYHSGLKTSNWESLLVKCHRTANYVIPKRALLEPFKIPTIKNREYEPDKDYFYKEQVLGIMWKYFKDDDVKWLKKHYETKLLDDHFNERINDIEYLSRRFSKN